MKAYPNVITEADLTSYHAPIDSLDQPFSFGPTHHPKKTTMYLFPLALAAWVVVGVGIALWWIA